jgi:methyltransferase
MIWYTALVLAFGCERIAEVIVSTRNARWSFARGGVEYGKGHFAPMVALHVGMLLACIAEVWIADRPFIPLLGVPMLILALASQALRWWCIATLGPRWNTRVIVVPGLPLVRRGPYRWFTHPNYIAVVVEGIALPLIYTAWVTALAFTVLNAIFLLAVRIPCENRALTTASSAASSSSSSSSETAGA